MWPGEHKGKVETENLENLYRRDKKKKKMTDTFEEDSSKEEPVNLESEVKTAVKVLGKINHQGQIK